MWQNIAAVREVIRQYNVNRVETYEGLAKRMERRVCQPW
jgi:hypothetical protein